MSGTLYGVGVGPGDPDLMTLKAVKVLKAVPVIAYIIAKSDDATKKSVARTIADQFIDPGKTEIEIPIAMLEDAAPGAAIYDDYAIIIAGHLDAGRDVAVLCEGDPLLYGSFMYMLERLRGDYTVETVPGVSSLGASAAAAGLPLVSRHQCLNVIPATLPRDDLQRRLAGDDAVAIFKVGRHLATLRDILRDNDRAQDAMFVERASQPTGRVMPLNDVPDGSHYFAMILVPARSPARSNGPQMELFDDR